MSILVIAGPTTTRKSEIACELARRLDGEIVCADSMTVYKGMDIGTAKPTAELREAVAHHLLDIAPPSEEFSAARYQELARRAIADIEARGKPVVMVGGTGLYIRAAVDDFSFPAAGSVTGMSHSEMVAELSSLDPELAVRIDVDNPRRVARALALARSGAGSEKRDIRLRSAVYDCRFFCLSMPKAVVDKRIDSRVDAMMAAGLLDEVRTLAQKKLGRTASQALGYKELLQYLRGNLTLDEAVETIKRRTKKYAKRQLTWFRADKRFTWLPIEESEPAAVVVERLLSLVQQGEFVVC